MVKRKPASAPTLIVREGRSAVVPVADLQPHPKNARQGDIGVIVESIKANGWYGELVVQAGTNVVVAGNHRLEAARALGMETVPVRFYELSDEEAERILLADNRTSDLAAYNDAALAELLSELAVTDAGLAGTGWDGDDLDGLLADLEREANDPWNDRGHRDSPKPERTQPGGLWTIGPHRILCADAQHADNVKRALDGNTINLVLTDPPYGIGYTGGGLERDAIENDEPGDEFNEFCQRWMRTIRDITPGGTPWYVFSAAGKDSVAGIFGALNGLRIARWNLVWIKDNATFSRSDYHYQHELIWYGWTPGGPHKSVRDRTQTSVINADRPRQSKDHPTEKPVDLLQTLVRNSSTRGGAVLDPFAGSGSTLVAAASEGRMAVGLEIVPGYAEVAAHRLAAATGQDAEYWPADGELAERS